MEEAMQALHVEETITPTAAAAKGIADLELLEKILTFAGPFTILATRPTSHSVKSFIHRSDVPQNALFLKVEDTTISPDCYILNPVVFAVDSCDGASDNDSSECSCTECSGENHQNDPSSVRQPNTASTSDASPSVSAENNEGGLVLLFHLSFSDLKKAATERSFHTLVGRMMITKPIMTHAMVCLHSESSTGGCACIEDCSESNGAMYTFGRITNPLGIRMLDIAKFLWKFDGYDTVGIVELPGQYLDVEEHFHRD